MQKITPSLWFDMNCEEAIKYYVKTFNGAPGSKKNPASPDKRASRGRSKIISITRYTKEMQTPGIEGMVGKVITAIFELNGQRFMALDGGPIFKFNESVSFLVDCRDQKEVDYFWKRLSAVKESEQCGWCKDKFGLSWQIIPKQLGELMSKDKSGRIMNAMLKMHKIVVKDLEKAYKGR